MKSKYVHLVELISDWAAQSGELESRILTYLCDYEARGRISPEAFRRPSTGGYPNPGELSEIVNLIRHSGYEIVRDDAANTLQEAVVSKEHILTLCRTYAIRPPRCVISLWRWYFWRGHMHETIPPFIATPEELESEQQAAKAFEASYTEQVEQQEELERRQAESKEKAEKSINVLNSIISEIENESQQMSQKKKLAECDEEWIKQVAVIQEFIGENSDYFFTGSIQIQLRDLETQHKEMGSQLSDVNSELGGSSGRPKNSGYAKADALLIEEMKPLITKAPFLSVQKAAERIVFKAEGSGTVDSKIKRLVRMYKRKEKSS